MSRPLRTTLAAGLLAALVVLSLVLADSQSSARRDIEDRFRERATASAALTESLFFSASVAARAQNRRRYGRARISPAALALTARQAGNAYLVVLSSRGRIVAASTGTPQAVRREFEATPAFVRDVLDGRPYALSDIRAAGVPRPALDYAQSFPTRFGRRVVVAGIDAKFLYQFLGGSLKQLPTVAGGHAYVLDSSGAIVASPETTPQAGAKVTEAGLVAASQAGRQGPFGDGRYFVADPVTDSTWRVVLTAPRQTLFASVSGSHKWVPWLLFIGFGVAAMTALAFVGRMLSSAAKVTLVNAELAQANAALEQRAAELALANEQLARANDELERSNEELERFASIASHDLQEPLRKVQMFAERITRNEGPQLSDKGRDSLERMSDAAQRMQALIDGLLVFSRITTRANPHSTVSLKQVARDVVGDLQEIIDESGAAVQIGDLPDITADPLQMRQLLQNLISNGLRFRRDGVAPVVRIDGRVENEVVELTVADNGIGFEPRYAQRIFRIFERLHPRSAYPGTGLGLALCRRIVERHGGTISAEGVAGVGATFTVTLPLVASDGPHPDVTSPATDLEDARLVQS